MAEGGDSSHMSFVHQLADRAADCSAMTVSSTNAPSRRPRWGIALGALLFIAGCATSTPERESLPVAAAPRIVAPVVSAPSTSAAPVATTTTIAPLGAHEVLVAVARPEIGELETYDAPGGTLLVHEMAMSNPWHFGGELALLVYAGREHDAWVQVGIPARPNGTLAWVRTADVTFRRHEFSLTVSVGERMVRAYEAGRLVFETPVAVGRAATPTPLGRFFINAIIPKANPHGAYGPVILSVSSFSETLESFDGGIPEIALHGTNQPALIGQAISNGCVRLSNEAVERLAALVPLGTPVEFVA
jgi:L,D-transpeptidase catalytic domain